MRATVLFTGGKDSTYALHLAYLQGYDIVVLSSIEPIYSYSKLYHKPMTSVLELQSKSLNIPLEVARVEDPTMEIEVLKKLLAKVKVEYGVGVVISGVVSSLYQKSIVDMVSEDLGLRHYAPLWLIDQARYMEELVDAGVVFALISITTYGLGREFLCRPLGRLDIEQIIRRSRVYGFNPAFEGGEAETLVLDAPLFSKSLSIDGHVECMGPHEYYCVVKNAVLVDKSLR